MTGEERAATDAWSVGVRVWIERHGRALLGPGRLELLEAIDRWRSISAAAREIGMSYRRAWLLVQSINEASKEPLVEAAVGGVQGGGARLTHGGRLAASIFRHLQDELHSAAATVLARVLEVPDDVACLHVAAAISLEEVLGQLLSDYALRQPAVKVRAVFGASNELAGHVLAGAPCEVFLSADAGQVERLEAAGFCRPDSKRELARNGLAAVARDDFEPQLKKPGDLRRAEVRRLALAEPASPLGRYSRDYLTRLGLLDTLSPRAVYVDNARGVVAALRAGQADVGLVYSSDAAAANCRMLFRARRTETPIAYFAVALARATSAEAAGAFVDFLRSKPAIARFRRCGFMPV
jgi:molybdate transport system substrate-binding protein